MRKQTVLFLSGKGEKGEDTVNVGGGCGGKRRELTPEWFSMLVIHWKHQRSL